MISFFEDFNSLADALIESSSFNEVIVRSPPSQGKSTLFPEILVRKGLRVFVAIPQVISTESLYHYMSGKISNEFTIGYAADSKVNYKSEVISRLRNRFSRDSDQLVYCTAGHLAGVMYTCCQALNNQNTNVNFCDIIILDEVHLQTKDISMVHRLHSYISKHYPNIMFPRIVLTSATYYNDDIPTFVISDESKFTITDFYLVNTPPPSIIYDVIGEMIKVNAEENSACLVFLPGLSEIERISSFLYRNTSNIEICIAHSSVKRTELNKIYSPIRPNTKRIILSTNIAETSITIPYVTVVIDSMLEKIPYETSTGAVHLSILPISKDSAEQRRGRTGRLNDGKCFRMCTEDEYVNLKDSRESEIKRLPIIHEIIKCLSSKVEPYEIFYDLDSKKLSGIINKLVEHQALDPITNQVTAKGEFIADLPLSFNGSLFIHRWFELGNPVYEGVILGILLDSCEDLIPRSNTVINATLIEQLVDVWNKELLKRNELIKRRHDSRTLTLLELSSDINNIMKKFIRGQITWKAIDLKEVKKSIKEVIIDIYPLYHLKGKSYRLKGIDEAYTIDWNYVGNEKNNNIKPPQLSVIGAYGRQLRYWIDI